LVGGHEVSIIDFDRDIAARPQFPNDYSLLYTIPPLVPDSRMERLLALLDPKPARIVYISTSAVYGDSGGRLVDESAPVDPLTGRARRRVAAEQRLRTWCVRHHCDWIILRAPAIYGPDRLSLDRLQKGEPVLAESDAHPGNRIHVDDLVRCCIAAMQSDAPSGIYNVADGDFRSASWFANTVARIAGLPRPPEISRHEAEETFSEMRMSFLNESRRLDNTKMRQVLSVEPRDPEAGIRDSLS
jgi:nucleoside-diphosphate-sugar epimerase